MPSTAAAAESLTRISTDPYTNPLPSQHKTQVEPDTFAFGRTLVSAFQSGRFFNGGASNIGFATSTNGGGSFRHAFLPSSTVFATPPGPYASATDASVAYDAKHRVWMISWLGLRTTLGQVDMLVSRSTDGGLTFGAPVVVNASGDNDKDWAVCDDTKTSPFYGNCYTEFDDANVKDLEQMSTSTDGGLTWGPAKTTANMAHAIGGQPLVQPNGNVLVPVVGLDSPLLAFQIVAFMSTDGGGSWGPTVTVANAAFHDPNQFGQPDGGIRAFIPLPSAEIDGSGKVYVVWSDCRFEAQCNTSALVMSTSTDGSSWTPVSRIPIDPVGSTVDHFLPGLAVDPNSSGHLGLLYYYFPKASCTVSTCQLNVGFVASNDGGSTWGGKEHLAGPMNLTWLPRTTQGRMVGDYMSTSIIPGTGHAHPVFQVAHPPSGTVFNQATYTTSEDVGTASAAQASSSSVSTGASASSRPAVRIPPPTAF